MKKTCSQCGATTTTGATCETCGARSPFAPRAENSVLFSLDSLSSLTSPERERRGAPPTRPAVAATTSSGDASGLIDVRSMAALLRDDGRHDPLLPRLGGLSLAPAGAALVVPASEPAVVAAPARATQTPLYVVLGLMLAAMGALAGSVLGAAEPAPPRITERVLVAAAPSAPERDDRPADDARDAEPSGPEATKEPATEPAPEAAPPLASPRKKQPRKDSPVAEKPEVDKKTPAPAAAPAARPAADDAETLKCLLEKGPCRKQPEAAPEPAPAPPVASDLPEKLDHADITEGTRAAKADAASSCKPLAKGGEAVKIKLSIAGPTGAVIGANAEDDAGNPKLGACCAAALMKASFKRVAKPQIGAVVTVKF